MPVSLATLGYWIVGGVIAGLILGVTFPRVTLVVLYPFAFIGIGSS
jgi:hypothetical protein